ncbi:MAG: type VI secretion system tube protein Hcp [Planctomycetota bacterium]
MATMKVYLKVDGMAGSCTEKNHKDFSDVVGFIHETTYPYDMREGKGRAEPEHGPFTVIKEIDKASPMLHEACAKKKKVNKVDMELWRDKPDGGGSEHYFQYTLENCRVVHIKPWMEVGSTSGKTSPPHLEEVSFAYQIIKWEHKADKKNTQFDFQNPTA